MMRAKLLAAIVGLLACLAVLFFAAFGWFCLIQQWDTAINVLCWSAIVAGAAAGIDLMARDSL